MVQAKAVFQKNALPASKQAMITLRLPSVLSTTTTLAAGFPRNLGSKGFGGTGTPSNALDAQNHVARVLNGRIYR